MYEYSARVVRVIDGDTVVVDLDMGLKIWAHNVHLRIKGIDCPEIRTKDLEEKERGRAAKAFVESRLPPGLMVRVQTYKASFERYEAAVWINDPEQVSLASLLVKEGHAVISRE